jgi:hypothetical protein
MSNASNHLEVALGNHLLRSSTFAKPTAVWLALFITAPNEDGTGGTEVSTVGTGYGRVQAGPADVNWSEPTETGEFISLVDFVFPEPTDDWGSIAAWGLYDAETGGNLLISAALIVPQNVADGGLAPKFAAGDLHVTFD